MLTTADKLEDVIERDEVEPVPLGSLSLSVGHESCPTLLQTGLQLLQLTQHTYHTHTHAQTVSQKHIHIQS